MSKRRNTACWRTDAAEGTAMTLAPQSRFAFPDYGSAELRQAILTLMSDGVPRSVLEIKRALNTEREIGARVRELRNGVYGPKYPFNDPRKDGAMEDGVFRYKLTLTEVA